MVEARLCCLSVPCVEKENKTKLLPSEEWAKRINLKNVIELCQAQQIDSLIHLGGWCSWCLSTYKIFSINSFYSKELFTIEPILDLFLFCFHKERPSQTLYIKEKIDLPLTLGQEWAPGRLGKALWLLESGQSLPGRPTMLHVEAIQRPAWKETLETSSGPWRKPVRASLHRAVSLFFLLLPDFVCFGLFVFSHLNFVLHLTDKEQKPLLVFPRRVATENAECPLSMDFSWTMNMFKHKRVSGNTWDIIRGVSEIHMWLGTLYCYLPNVATLRIKLEILKEEKPVLVLETSDSGPGGLYPDSAYCIGC